VLLLSITRGKYTSITAVLLPFTDSPSYFRCGIPGFTDRFLSYFMTFFQLKVLLAEKLQILQGILDPSGINSDDHSLC
jgi:hypothetical protein